MSYHQSLCLGHTRATSYHQSFCLGHTTAKSYYLQFCHFLKMSCSAKDVATVLRKFQHHAGMSFLHTQVLRKKCSQLVYSCSILYLQNSQSTFISHHLISVWSYQQELHHLLTFSFPSLNIPKWKPVCSFHKLSLIFHKYHMSDLWRDCWHLPQVYVNTAFGVWGVGLTFTPNKGIHTYWLGFRGQIPFLIWGSILWGRSTT